MASRMAGGLLCLAAVAPAAGCAPSGFSHSDEPLRCNTVANFSETIPPEDIDQAAIQSGLNLDVSQLNKVDKFPATCYVPAGEELGFGKGVPIRGDLYQSALSVIYKSCIVYGVPTRMLPDNEDETRPAVVACIDPIPVREA